MKTRQALTVDTISAAELQERLSDERPLGIGYAVIVLDSENRPAEMYIGNGLPIGQAIRLRASIWDQAVTQVTANQGALASLSESFNILDASVQDFLADPYGASLYTIPRAADLAARAAYDDEDEDFLILVEDNTGITDGADRAAVYAMGSGGSADWNGPVWVTGPKGPAGDDGVSPLHWAGVWSAGTYYYGDIVENGGVAYIVTSADTTQEPPDTDWDVFLSVSGSGDVIGPAVSTDNAIARFDGVTGKLLQTSSASISDSGQIGAGVTPSAMLHAKAADNEPLLRLDKGSGSSALSVSYDGTYVQATLGAVLSISGSYALLKDGTAVLSSGLSLGNTGSAYPTTRWHIVPGWNAYYDRWLLFRRNDYGGWVVALSDNGIILASGKSLSLYSTALITSQDLGSAFGIQLASTTSAATAKTIFTNQGLGWLWNAAGATTKMSLDGSGNLNIQGALTAVGATFTDDIGVTGDIAVTGTVDGRNISTDGAKLDGIEAGAQVVSVANIAVAVNSTGDKSILVDADEAIVVDSENSYTLARITWANLKASAAQILSATANKLMTAAQFWASLAEVTLTDGATIAVDMNTFINAKVTLGGNRTLGNPTNLKVGQEGVIRVIQDGTGSRTLSYDTYYTFGSIGTPTLSTAAADEDLLFYKVITTTKVFLAFVKDI